MDINSFISSQAEMLEEESSLRDWEQSLLTMPKDKCCKSIQLFNTSEVKPLPLVTKESIVNFSGLSKALQSRVYTLHRLIIIVYAPAVRSTTTGTLSMNLWHAGTGETIQICEDHPVSKSVVFVARWPRAVLTGNKGIALLVQKENVSVLRSGFIGTLYPYWEDKLSSKMIYEKELPVLKYDVEEQDPALYVKNPAMLRTMLTHRIALGKTGSDVQEQTIGLSTPALKNQPQAQFPSAVEPRVKPVPVKQVKTKSSLVAISSASAPQVLL